MSTVFFPITQTPLSLTACLFSHVAFSASEARYARSASRSSDTGSQLLLLLALTGNPADLHISRRQSRSISAKAALSHSSPLLATSSCNRCRSAPGCRGAASSECLPANMIAGNPGRVILYVIEEN